MKWMLPLALISVFTLASCKSGEEADDLAKAQECLDEVTEANYASAADCLPLVKDHDSQQAKILRCSILMTSGGLTETKIVKGYKALENDQIPNKEMAFMAVLALEDPANTGIDIATRGNEQCQGTGVPGLKFISTMILAGTSLAKTMVMNGITIDLNNPGAAATALLAQCGVDPIPPNCQQNVASLGPAIVDIAQNYCDQEDADDKMCIQMTSVVAATQGDTTKVGNALLCYMQKPPKAYNAATDGCI
ncbi:MAG TPA: hypothetical protein PKC28_09535 [Bdellovibrionales bacterium]|nr:hypothetical protein [Bdellovibrionales bacterium]